MKSLLRALLAAAFALPFAAGSPAFALPVAVSYTGPAVSIPDNNPAGVNIPLVVSGVGVITDLNVRFDTVGACDSNTLNTNAAVNHSFVGDLVFKLTSPSGATATFWSRRGGTRENICSTTIDDDGGLPALTTITSVTGQSVSGNFSPESTGPLSVFEGVNAEGTWNLNVSDNATIDTGTLRRFSLVFESGCTSLICPANITTSVSPGGCGRVVSYPAPIIIGAGCGTVICAAPSGSQFPAGAHTVTCQSPSAGKSCSFQVQVIDTEAPVLSCPSGIAVSTASGFGAALEFSSSAADNCPGAPSVQCDHVSGGIFPVGETAVTCTSTDSSGNTGNCTFPAKVNGNVNIDSLPGERPVCTGGAKIRRATLVVKNIGGASPGGQSATLKGSVKFTKSVYPLISGQAHGAQIQLADVGNGSATLFELSERTDPVAAGTLGGAGACGSGDGWSSTNVYANATNRLGSPTCIDASANGLRSLSLGAPKKKTGLSALKFKVEGARLAESAVNGPLSTVVVFGSNLEGSAGQCASAEFKSKRCKRNGSTLTCKN